MYWKQPICARTHTYAKQIMEGENSFDFICTTILINLRSKSHLQPLLLILCETFSIDSLLSLLISRAHEWKFEHFFKKNRLWRNNIHNAIDIRKKGATKKTKEFLIFCFVLKMEQRHLGDLSKNSCVLQLVDLIIYYDLFVSSLITKFLLWNQRNRRIQNEKCVKNSFYRFSAIIQCNRWNGSIISIYISCCCGQCNWTGVERNERKRCNASASNGTKRGLCDGGIFCCRNNCFTKCRTRCPRL